MILRNLTGTLRGVIAWLTGYVLVAILVLFGLVDGSGIVSTAADIYITAHTIPGLTGSFEWVLFIPALVIGLLGFRLGNGVGRGLLGRLKAFVASRGDSRAYRLKTAGKQLAIVGCGYLLATLIGATLAGVSTGDALVHAAIVFALVGAPATGFGVFLAEQ